MANPRHVATPIPGGRSARRSGGKGIELFTLGGVRLLRQGTDETAKLGAKHLALMVYLFHEQRPMHPSEVIELLGRGQDEEKESDALRKAVKWLKDHMPGVNLRYSGETIEALGGVTVDTHDVDAAIDQGDAECVADLYAGEFLEGFESSAPAFDEWAQKERGRIKRAWSHAIASAARESERLAGWDMAAIWWQVLVSRAPIRPEAVAGLLNALARAKREEDAARAFAAYVARLQKNGVAQPADEVREVVERHTVLKNIAEGQITPSGPIQVVKPRAAEPPPPPPSPKPAVPIITDEPVAPTSDGAESAVETETIAGFEGGSSLVVPEAPPARPAAPPPAKPADPPAGGRAAAAGAGSVPDFLADSASPSEKGWDDLVDLTKQDDFDIPITKPKPPPAGPAKPAAAIPSKPPARRRPVEEDEALKQAREAAAAFVDNEYGRVRHQVTGVRKQWSPVLQNWWKELAPWRQHMWDLTISALEWAAKALMALVPLIARGSKAAGRSAYSGLAATRARLKRPKKEKRPKPKKEKKPKKAKVELMEVEATSLGKPAAKPKPLAAPEKVKPAKPEAKRGAPPEKARPKEIIEEVADSEFEDFAQSFATEDPLLDGFPTSRSADGKAATFDEALPGEFSGPAPVIDDAWGRPPPPPANAVPWEAELPPIEPTIAKKKWTLPRVPVLPLLRQYWYAPIAIAAMAAAFVFGPTAFRAVRGFTSDLPDRLPDVQAPSVPSITVPRVTVPRVTIRTPSFIETSVSRIGEMLSGPLLDESGEWVLVADVRVDAPPGPLTSDVLTTALELDLQQARFFFVVPRERALVARRRESGTASESLPVADALTLARSQGYALVLAGRLFHGEGDDSTAAVDSVSLRVLNAAGDTLYGVAAQVDSSAIVTLAGLSRAVRRRMGEPEEETAASKQPTDFLSAFPEAIAAYHEARMHLFGSRYAQAASAAQRAVEIDPSFALAYRLMAEAQALRGWRTAARNSLELAWQFADGTTERERKRILADRHAWDGRREEAAITYDDIFYTYRDDVGALKAQAILQRAIGVRGMGLGNLRVAYEIDRYDWPRLDRIARYLGYGGRLPDVDSLIATIDSGN